MRRVSAYQARWVTRGNQGAQCDPGSSRWGAGRTQLLLVLLLVLGLASTLIATPGAHAEDNETTGKTIYVDCNKPAEGDSDKTDDTGDGSLGNPFGTLGSNTRTEYLASGGGVNGALINNPGVTQVLFATGGTCVGTFRPQISGIDKNNHLVIGAYDPDGDGKKLESTTIESSGLVAPVLSGYELDPRTSSLVVDIENQHHITIENLTISAPLITDFYAYSTNAQGQQVKTPIQHVPAYNPSEWDKNKVLSTSPEHNKTIRTDAEKITVAEQARVAIKITNTGDSETLVSDITIRNTTIKDINCTSNGCSGYTKDRTTDKSTNNSYQYIDLAAIMITDMRPINQENTKTPIANITISNNTFDNISTYGVRSWTRANREYLIHYKDEEDKGYSINDVKALERPINRLVVENNTFTNLGKGAVIAGNTLDASIINNTITRHGLNNRHGSAGIWPYYSKNTIIKNNTITDGQPVNDKCDTWNSYSRSQQQKVIDAMESKKEIPEGLEEQFIGCNEDGQAIDIDAGSIDTLIENNTSSNNARGFLLICGAPDIQKKDEYGKPETVGANQIQNATIRYNTSYNDNTYGIRFNCSGLSINTRIHNNTTILNANTWNKTTTNGQPLPLEQAVFTNCTNGNCLFFDNPTMNEDTDPIEKGEPATQNWGNQFYYVNNLTAIYGDASATTSIRRNNAKETGKGAGTFVGKNNYMYSDKANTITNPTNKDQFRDVVIDTCVESGATNCINNDKIFNDDKWYKNAEFPSFYESTNRLGVNPLVGTVDTLEHVTEGDGAGNGWLDAGTDAYKLNLDQLQTDNTAYTALIGNSINPNESWSNIKATMLNAATNEDIPEAPSYEDLYKLPHDIYGNPATFPNNKNNNNDNDNDNDNDAGNSEDSGGSGVVETDTPNIGAANAVKAKLSITSPENGEQVGKYPTFTGIGDTGAVIEIHGANGWNTCGTQQTDTDGTLLYITKGDNNGKPLLQGPTVDNKGQWSCQTVLEAETDYGLHALIKQTLTETVPGQEDTQIQETTEDIVIYLRNN